MSCGRRVYDPDVYCTIVDKGLNLVIGFIRQGDLPTTFPQVGRDLISYYLLMF